MQEIYRVLRPGSWALVLVPIQGEHTIEDQAVMAPEERVRLFGQADHVRRYGRDIADRLCEAGFRVSVYSTLQIAGEEGVERFGLYAVDSGVVFFCEKVWNPPQPVWQGNRRPCRPRRVDHICDEPKQPRDAVRAQRDQNEEALLPAIEFLARVRFNTMINANRHQNKKTRDHNDEENIVVSIKVAFHRDDMPARDAL